MRIGLLTDTHLPGTIRELWPEVHKAFTGCDLILHGGDIVSQGVLDWLEQIAPVLAAKGNNDWDWGDSRVKDTHFLDVEGWRLGMVHDMEPEDRPIEYLRKQYLKGERVDVMVTGHTHFERLTYRDGVVQINSGSPIHPHLWSTRLGTVGVLDITRSRIQAQVVKLGETPGMRNPGLDLSVTVRR
ncbi:MAG: metallophosphoesterase family protein [Chloroflexi bacterium]|nr:metallophosphoesterase family protein [Chloroflexota bacterium]